MELDPAIRLIKRTTPANDPWTGADISEDPKTATDTDDAIARILNAVVSGELVPPATECPFGDDCDLTVAYMAGAASKRNASMMTASQLAADDDAAPQMPQDVASLIVELRADAELHEDLLPDRAADVIVAQVATIARLTEERDKWRNDCLDANASELSLRKRAEQAEAKLAEVTAAGTFAQGIEAAAKEWQNVRVEGGVAVAAVMAYSDRIRALSPTPQADPVREPTEAMLEAAADWSRCKYGIPIGNDAAIGCWQAMYDALAGEQP